MAVAHPIVTRYQIDVFNDADIIDRTRITYWLMHWHLPSGVNITDYRGGQISVSGIMFSGTAVDVFDNFISDLIFEFEDRWTRATEDELQNIPVDIIDQASEQFAGIIETASSKLMARAVEIRQRLAKQQIGRLRLLPRNSPPPRERLRHASEAMKSSRTRSKTSRSWTQAFWNENKGPIAASIAVLGLIVAVIALFRS